jgi:hypothetical protein
MSLQANPNKTFQGALNGTATQCIFYMKTLDVDASAVLDYAIITAGFTVDISLSTSDSAYPSLMVWNKPAALTGIVGSTNGTRDRYSSNSFTAIKVERISGSGTFEFVISTNGAAASGGTVAVPSVVQGASASGATAAGNPVPIAGVAHSTPRSFTAGQSAVAGTDLAGNIEVTQGTYVAGEDVLRNRLAVEKQFNSTRITTAATTVCLSGVGTIDSIFVEVALTGTATVYDNVAASGTIITILPIGAVGSISIPRKCSLGATVVTSAADRLVVFTQS